MTSHDTARISPPMSQQDLSRDSSHNSTDRVPGQRTRPSGDETTTRRVVTSPEATDFVAFLVHGDPVPQGSLRAFVRDGRPILTYGRAASLGAWRQAIADRCTAAMAGSSPLIGPVAVVLRFRVRRPRGHYGARGTVTAKYAATGYPTVAPDLDKLARAALDGMTGIAYRDEAQVARLDATKEYAESPGLTVHVGALDTAPGTVVGGVEARLAPTPSPTD